MDLLLSFQFWFWVYLGSMALGHILHIVVSYLAKTYITVEDVLGFTVGLAVPLIQWIFVYVLVQEIFNTTGFMRKVLLDFRAKK